ncbi:MAG: ubiquinol-cytochrome c reductase iron-sulfur subunit N-terminal domain-containing protein [Phycisphaerae bacterium]
MPNLQKNKHHTSVDRREFLMHASIGVAAIGLAAATTTVANQANRDGLGGQTPATASFIPRGSIYIPARAWNAYQMWQYYDSKIIRRDIGYAQSLRLNALRVWLSYEFWLTDHAAFQQRFDHFLHSCSTAGITVMPVLFEGDGVEPTPTHIADTHPMTASDLLSPSSHVVTNRRLWHRPMEYLDWFMEHFRDDRRLLAIEVQNEPWGAPRHHFAEAMVRHAAKQRGTVPLSIGGANLKQSMAFMKAGADILQTHPDFPPSSTAVSRDLHDILRAQRSLKKPVWMTEWQRIRTDGSGWGNRRLTGTEWEPDYASMAPLIRARPVGNFFWSLMLKPAWLLAQRRKGTLNGVFHEDGAVWSLTDARSISGNIHFQAVQRKVWPRWAKMIPESIGLKIR